MSTWVIGSSLSLGLCIDVRHRLSQDSSAITPSFFPTQDDKYYTSTLQNLADVTIVPDHASRSKKNQPKRISKAKAGSKAKAKDKLKAKAEADADIIRMTKSRSGSEADAARKDIKGNEMYERSTLKLRWRW